jgi:hypothetical protein
MVSSSWFIWCFSFQAIRTGWVHPNLNLENPEKTVVSLFTDADLMLFLSYFFY